MNTERIALPVTVGLKQAAREAAKREGRPVANFCRRAIEEALPPDLYESYLQFIRDGMADAKEGGSS